jgi:hypothetical protein
MATRDEREANTWLGRPKDAPIDPRLVEAIVYAPPRPQGKAILCGLKPGETPSKRDLATLATLEQVIAVLGEIARECSQNAK